MLRGLKLLGTKAVVLEEVVDGAVGARSGVLKVETVAGTWHNSDLEVFGIGEHGSRSLGDRLEASWGSEAVSTAEWKVTLTGDDEDWGLGWILAAGSAADGEELTDGHGLAGHGSNLEDLGVKDTFSEEIGLDSGCGGWGEVAVREGSKSRVQVGLGEAFLEC